MQCDSRHKTLAEEGDTTDKWREATGQPSWDEKDGEEGLTTNWPEGTAKIGGVGMKQKVTDHGIGRSTAWKEQKHK